MFGQDTQKPCEMPSNKALSRDVYNAIVKARYFFNGLARKFFSLFLPSHFQPPTDKPSKMIALKRFYCFFFVLFLVLNACEPSKEEVPDVSHIEVNMEFERADQKIMAGQSREEIQDYLKANPQFAVEILRIDAYPSQQILVESLYKLGQDTLLQKVYAKSQEVFGDMTEVKQELTETSKYIKHYYPEFTPPKVYTMVSGFEYDLVLRGEIAGLGLDYYLGKHVKYRPIGPDGQPIPSYIAARYQPEYIPVHYAKFLSGRFVQRDFTDKSILAEMIAWGKALYFTKKVLPYTADTLVFEQSTQQLADAYANVETIWGHFVERKLFYETSRQIKAKYIEDRPFVSEISQACMGRVGRWLGYLIVEAYMKRHPDVTLRQLLENTDAQHIFEQSKFKPKNLSEVTLQE